MDTCFTLVSWSLSIPVLWEASSTSNDVQFGSKGFYMLTSVSRVSVVVHLVYVSVGSAMKRSWMIVKFMMPSPKINVQDKVIHPKEDRGQSHINNINISLTRKIWWGLRNVSNPAVSEMTGRWSHHTSYRKKLRWRIHEVPQIYSTHSADIVWNSQLLIVDQHELVKIEAKLRN